MGELVARHRQKTPTLADLRKLARFVFGTGATVDEHVTPLDRSGRRSCLSAHGYDCRGNVQPDQAITLRGEKREMRARMSEMLAALAKRHESGVSRG